MCIISLINAVTNNGILLQSNIENYRSVGWVKRKGVTANLARGLQLLSLHGQVKEVPSTFGGLGNIRQ